jgi:hypothetical protein
LRFFIASERLFAGGFGAGLLLCLAFDVCRTEAGGRVREREREGLLFGITSGLLHGLFLVHHGIRFCNTGGDFFVLYHEGFHPGFATVTIFILNTQKMDACTQQMFSYTIIEMECANETTVKKKPGKEETRGRESLNLTKLTVWGASITIAHVASRR